MKTVETYQQQKKRHQEEVNSFEGIFFAFSNEQFEEGMKKLGINNAKEELYSIGAGGYIKKERSKDFHNMFKRHAQERKQREKDEKFLLEALVYELRNHEYCITCDVTDALEALDLTINDISPKLLKKAKEMAYV